jgi:hypothetical protein
MPKRLEVTLALAAMLAAASWSQAPSSKLNPPAQKIHWQKYVNKEFGFVLRYPDSYQRVAGLEYCRNNQYFKYLLCLVRKDDPDATILVTIDVQGPFYIKSNRADIKYTPQQIGRYLFYCGIQGSMGPGFSDECTYNLKNKMLAINYSPAQTINTGVDMNPLMLKSLKTFRTF